MQQKTSLITYIGKLFKKSLSKKERTISIEFPLSCKSVEERNQIIYSTINLLEQKIIIKNK